LENTDRHGWVNPP